MRVTRKQLDQAIKCFTRDTADEFEIRHDYSGRGMYGRTCFGVVASSLSVPLGFMFALAEQMCNDPEDTWEQREIVMELAEDMLTDSMGYRDMIYYFPKLTVED